MADIELVIRINKEVVEAFDKAKKENALNYYMNVYKDDLYNAIKNGTPLPKGHGKIKDINEIEWYGCTTAFDCPYKDKECKDCDKAECSKTQVDDIPTIIEADVTDINVGNIESEE